MLQEEAWPRQGCRCRPAPTVLTGETKPLKLLRRFCWGTVKSQAHGAAPQFRPSCAPGCDTPAALCWREYVLGLTVQTLGSCIGFLLCL